MPSRERIDVLPLLPGPQEELLRLLEARNPEDWDRPTACSQWTVKDIAAHLLDGNLRKLSPGRMVGGAGPLPQHVS